MHRGHAAATATAEPSVGPTDQLVRQFVSGAVTPDAFLIGLRRILRQSRDATGTHASPEEVQQDQPKEPASCGLPGQTTAPAQKRGRGPDLETSRERVKLREKLASELAAIREQVRVWTTLANLKGKYPKYEIWKLLSESEQEELLNGGFKPRAYAGHLVLREHGLTSLETLRKDRQKLRKAGE
jgi:hypothetical protein